MCPHHRAMAAKYRNSESGKRLDSKRKATYKKTAKGKAADKRRKTKYRASDKGIKTEFAYAQSDAGKQSKAKRTAKYWLTDKGRSCKDRMNFKRRKENDPKYIMRYLSASLRAMVRGSHPDPVSFPSLGSFESNADAQLHLESTFDRTWMNWQNHGKHEKGDSYKSKWQIGHRLPKAIFDPNNDEDLRRCWDRDNIFAQCARENVEQLDWRNLNDSELLKLQHLWPTKAQNQLDHLKRLYRSRQADLWIESDDESSN